MKRLSAEFLKSGQGEVIMSVVDVIPPEQIEASRMICEKLGAKLRVRKYDE